jgi:pyruvate decarboxylase
MATVSLGVYIWKRLASLGVEHVFGVPGDFNCTTGEQPVSLEVRY